MARKQCGTNHFQPKLESRQPVHFDSLLELNILVKTQKREPLQWRINGAISLLLTPGAEVSSLQKH